MLSRTLEIEEPGGVLCIQTALNDPANSMMVTHEMQIIKHLARVCMLESSTAGNVSRESVRARLVAEGFPVVDGASYLVLFNFVIAQGVGAQEAFVEPLVEFHELLVNPRVRRLREHHFRVVCLIPSPIVRLYVLKVAYSCPPQLLRDGWIDYFGAGLAQRLAARKGDVLNEVESLYCRFQNIYSESGLWREAREGMQQLYLFDVDVGRIVLAKEGYAGSLDEIRALAGAFDERIRASIRDSPFAKTLSLPDALPLLPEVGKKRQRKQEECNQHSVLKGSQTSEHPWVHVPDLRQDALFREKSCILWALSLAAQTAQLPGVSELSVSTDGDGMRVCVTRPFPAATLILLPMVPG